METIEEIKAFILPILSEHKVELVDMTLGGPRGKKLLRLLIDKPGGIKLDECSLINREVGNLLDEESSSDDSYILEVSSPGLDRPLTDQKSFKFVLGKVVSLHTKEAFNGRYSFKGIVSVVGDNGIILDLGNDEKLDIEYTNISKAKLEIKF